MGSSCCRPSDTDDTQPLDRTQPSRPQRQGRSHSSRRRSHGSSRRVPQGQVRARRQFHQVGGSLQSQGAAAQAHQAEQIRIAQRQQIIDQLPSSLYHECAKRFYTECPICLLDFEGDDQVKSLPCMHLFHTECIDDWLMRNLRCPSCMEPVDAALFSQFDNFASI